MTAKITAIEIISLELPLKEPFVIAYHAWDSMPAILLRVETDLGIEGWGEAVPDPNVTSETLSS